MDVDHPADHLAEQQERDDDHLDPAPDAATDSIDDDQRRERRDGDQQRLFALVYSACLYGSQNALQ